MATLRIMTGTMDCHFADNTRIAIDNFSVGRPLFANWLPATHVPDPNGLPPVITLIVPDEKAP